MSNIDSFHVQVSCSGRLIMCWGTWHVLFASCFRERLSFLVCPLSMVLNSIQLEIVRVMHFGNQNSLPEMQFFFCSTMRDFSKFIYFISLCLCVFPPYILLPADPFIPAQSLSPERLGEGPNHLLIHHSAFEPSAFWAEKKRCSTFFSVPPYSRCS